MFRDRTNLYLSYRRTVPRNTESGSSRFDSQIEEEERLIESRRGEKSARYKDVNNAIEMQLMRPSMFDIGQSIDGNIAVIKSKTNELSSLYKRLLITNYNEKQAIESKIEDLNYEITKIFENSYVLIKKFEFLQKNHGGLKLNYGEDELVVLDNLKKTYAWKIQNSSLVFRNLQNNYIKFLRDDEDETGKLLDGIDNDEYDLIQEETETKNIEDYSKQVLKDSQSQVQVQGSNSRYLQSREREISKLAMGILEISTIFKEMESLIIDQGTILDRIDYNLQNTVQDLKLSDKELLKAQTYQKRTTKCKIIFLLSLIVFALFMIVLVKPHGKDRIVEKPPPNDQSDQRPDSEKVDPEKAPSNGADSESSVQ